MIYDVTITIKPSEEKNKLLIEKKIFDKLFGEHKNISDKKNYTLVLKKKSIDARHRDVKIHLRYAVYDGNEITKSNENISDFAAKWHHNLGTKTAIIVGSGPAGLFCALKLLEYGVKPIVLERGRDTHKRKIDIANISKNGIVDENSNYCFGEGGAGTFSDGKLFTRSKKKGNIENILTTFVFHGAPSSILVDAHAHIGSDKLPQIVENIVRTIRDCGGEVLFDTKVTDFILETGTCSTKPLRILGVVYADTKNHETKSIYADAVFLGSGHSATDIYSLLEKIQTKYGVEGIVSEKDFALGVRLEHPKSVIDKIQYHGTSQSEFLPSAEYRLTTQVLGRGVYSFCMCPGGFVVPSQSCAGKIVVNGMSSSLRNSKWSNAAIVVQTLVDDCKEMLEFLGAEKDKKENGALKTLAFRNLIEEQTFLHGKGQMAPAQRLVDFICGTKSESLPTTSYAPGVVSSRLDLWLPPFITTRLKQAFKIFDSEMHGLICPDALLIATESRTSTPVRIERDKETYESKMITGFYPIGEGSGYSGGIVSSALDGENSARAFCVLQNHR